MKFQLGALLRSCELAKQGIGIATAHRLGREHGEADAVVDVTDLGGFSSRWKLPDVEVIGGEANDLQALVAILLIERFQALELGRETAVTGGVDDQQQLVIEGLAKVDLLAGTQFLRLEVEQ